KRGSRMPFERATLPMLPAVAGVLLYAISRVATREAAFDDYVGTSGIKVAAEIGAVLGLVRIFTGYFEVNAPPVAKTKWFYARVLARIRVFVLARSRPRIAAQALRDLGEPVQGAELLLAAGLLREAGAEFL